MRLRFSRLGGVVSVVVAGALTAAQPAMAKSAVGLTFHDSQPATIAPLLASECTHRRMFLIRNTPEKVICRFDVRSSSEDGGEPITTARLWTFVLNPLGDDRTRVSAESELEGATLGGYAVISVAGKHKQERAAISAFLHDAQALNGLRGAYAVGGPTQAE